MKHSRAQQLLLCGTMYPGYNEKDPIYPAAASGYNPAYARDPTAQELRQQMNQPQVPEKGRRSLGRAATLGLYYVVPETARTRLSQRAAITTGLIYVILFIIALAGLAYYNLTLQKSVLTSQSSNGCTPFLVAQNAEYALDTASRWENVATFDPAHAYWRVSFVNYTADVSLFQRNMYSLQYEANLFVDRLVGRHYYEVMQLLLYSNLTMAGKQGYMRIMPSLDLGTMLADRIATSSQLRNVSQYRDRPLTTTELQTYIMGKWPTASCSSNVLVHGVNKLQLGVDLAATTNFVLSDFPEVPPSSGDYQITVFDADHDIHGAYCDKHLLNVTLLDNVPDIQNLTQHRAAAGITATGNSHVLSWDAGQVFALDFCNHFRAACLDYLQVNSTQQAVALNRFVWMRSSETYPTTYLPGVDKLGYEFDTDALTGPWIVVPELLPHFDCATCPGDGPEYCQSFLGVELHFYYSYSPAAGALQGTYYNTYEYSMILSKYLNQNLATASLECDASSLKFNISFNAPAAGNSSSSSGTINSSSITVNSSAMSYAGAEQLTPPFQLQQGLFQCVLTSTPVEVTGMIGGALSAMYTGGSLILIIIVLLCTKRNRLGPVHSSAGSSSSLPR